MLFLYMILY